MTLLNINVKKLLPVATKRTNETTPIELLAVKDRIHRPTAISRLDDAVRAREPEEEGAVWHVPPIWSEQPKVVCLLEHREDGGERTVRARGGGRARECE